MVDFLNESFGEEFILFRYFQSAETWSVLGRTALIETQRRDYPSKNEYIGCSTELWRERELSSVPGQCRPSKSTTQNRSRPRCSFRLSGVVPTGLYPSPDPPHSLEKNFGQSRLFEGSQNMPSIADNNGVPISNDALLSRSFPWANR
jgi:hypothetical protein